ncbi:basic amino acid/polyamine antiporter [Candidatus Saccharibacteria bacterium]|nr:basic amino acid/polyamine antiporter [Candidatus Saccharibacteria bacterium]
MAEQQVKTRKEAKLGLLSLSALVIGGIIGSGIFNLMKEMAIDSSPMAVIIAWVVAAIGMGALVISFYNLNKKRPELDAGVYSYAEKGFGKFMGFNSAWSYWISGWIGNVAYATITFSALGYFFHVFGDGTNWESVIGASIGLWLVAALVISGIKNASFMNVIVTIAKFIPLVIFMFALFAAFRLHLFNADLWGAAMKNGSLQWSDLLTQVKGTMLATVFVFIGIEGAVVFSGRAKDKKNVGKATAIGFLTVVALYILITVLSFGVMTQAKLAGLNEPAMAQVLESIVGKWGAVLVNIGVVVSVVGAWLAWTLFTLELPYRAAKQGVFPKVFAKETKKHVPWVSLLITTLVTQIFVFSYLISDRPYNLMFSLCASMILVPYLFVALFQLKESWKEKHNSKGRTWNMIVGAVATIYAVWLLYAGGVEYLLTMVILYALGIGVYVWARKGFGEKRVFKTWEAIVAVLLIIVAIYGVYWMATGGYTQLVG